MARITIDQSASSIILFCQDCAVWHAFADDLAAAHDSAVAHENRTHPGTEEAAHARREWRRRARNAAATRR